MGKLGGNKNLPPLPVPGHTPYNLIAEGPARHNWEKAARGNIEKLLNIKFSNFAEAHQAFKDYINNIKDSTVKKATGVSIYNKTREDFYKLEAENPSFNYSSEQIEDLGKGNAPRKSTSGRPKQSKYKHGKTNLHHVLVKSKNPELAIDPMNLIWTEGGEGALERGYGHKELQDRGKGFEENRKTSQRKTESTGTKDKHGTSETKRRIPGAKVVNTINSAQGIVEAINNIKYLINHGNMIKELRDLHSFIPKVLFWYEFGIIPYVQGVDDDFGQFSPEYITDQNKVFKYLVEGGYLDAFYIRHSPENNIIAITDKQFNIFEKNVNSKVKNYDEYCTYFTDGNHNAVSWINTWSKYWIYADWRVRVAHYDTNWENKVKERWVVFPRFTKIMSTVVKNIIANTDTILEMIGKGTSPRNFDTNKGHSKLGFFNFPEKRPTHRAKLKSKGRNAKIQTIPELLQVNPNLLNYGKLYKTHDVSFGSSPSFYVWGIDNEWVTVGGTSFNYYYPIRNLYTFSVRSRPSSNDGHVKYKISNVFGVGRIKYTDLDIYPL